MINYSISIIIPIYNAQDYIGRCLDSISSQCCEGVAIECILVNDYTPDNSMDVVREKIRDNNDRVKFKIINHTVKDNRCRLYVQQKEHNRRLHI